MSASVMPLVVDAAGADGEDIPSPPRHRTVRELTAEARSLLGGPEVALLATQPPEILSLSGASAALSARADDLSRRLDEGGARPIALREVNRQLAKVQALRLEIAEHQARLARNRARAATAAIRELRATVTLDQIFGLVPAKLCDCGFTRAWISAVEGGRWRPLALHGGIPEATRRFDSADPAAWVPLVHGSPEAEILRRRRPMLVADLAKRPESDPWVAAVLRARSYVAAPLLLDTRVVALLHADRPSSEAPLEEPDLDVLGLFAEAVSQAIARVMLSERIERLRIDAASAARSVEQLIEDRCCEGVSLIVDSVSAPGEGSEHRVHARPASYAPVQGSARLSGLLTAREIEVLKLMAAGETNAGIARELVISEGTVKSHVKSVLRKLRVANRAQAVSRYFRVIRAEETP